MAKITIRKGTFETNSSSTHAICINTNSELETLPKEVTNICGRKVKNTLKADYKYEFGCESKRYYDFEHKFDYLWQAIIEYYSCYSEIEGYEDEDKLCPIYKKVSIEDRIKMIFTAKEKIMAWLNEGGYTSVYLVNPKIAFWGNTVDHLNPVIYADTKNEGYINHGTETDDFVEGVLSDKKIFMAYLFGKDSCICTGTDNGDGPFYPEDMSIYDIEYFKGN